MSERTRVLFVIPPYFEVSDYMHRDTGTVYPAFTSPYGVLSIDAYIRKNVDKAVKTGITDLNVDALKIIQGRIEHTPDFFMDLTTRRVKDFNPDIVGISALFNTSYKDLAAVSEAIKKGKGSALVVAGGGLPTNLHAQILEECPFIDAICYGEGEIPMADLLNSDDPKHLIMHHRSWVGRTDVAPTKDLGNSFVHDLDDIPPFDYSLTKLDDYNSRSLDKRFADDELKREMSIHTSRGCPFNCVFCANMKLHGHKVRFMSIDRVLREVRRMKTEFGLTVLLIEDDHFFADKERAKTLLAGLREFNIRIEFPNGVAVYSIDNEVGRLLREAGVSSVSLAIESGSDYVLQKIINKPLKTSMIKQRVDILRKNRISAHAFIVLGLPGEMDEHRRETEEMLLRTGFDWVHVFIGIPVVGSRLYEICVANDYLVKGDMRDHTISKANIRAPGVDPEKIEETAYRMNLLVNFVSNANMRLGNYEKAASYFRNVADRYPDHALAHYFLACAYEHMERDDENVRKHMMAFARCLENSDQWREYAEEFGLPLQDYG